MLCLIAHNITVLLQEVVFDIPLQYICSVTQIYQFKVSQQKFSSYLSQYLVDAEHLQFIDFNCRILSNHFDESDTVVSEIVAEELTLNLRIILLVFMVGMNLCRVCKEEVRHNSFKFLNNLYKLSDKASILSKCFGGHQLLYQDRPIDRLDTVKKHIIYNQAYSFKGICYGYYQFECVRDVAFSHILPGTNQ